MTIEDILVVNQSVLKLPRFKGVRSLNEPSTIHRALNERRNWRRTAWLALDSGSANMLLDEVGERKPKALGTLALLKSITPSRLAVATNYFIAVCQPDLVWLPPEQVISILHSDEPRDRIVAGMVDNDAGKLLIYRGDLQPIVASLDSFSPRAGAEPDFDDFEIIDWGHTVRFGGYEAAADAILYENDPEFRSRKMKQRRSQEKTFGASLRRLRLQRELRQADFEPEVSAKSIARLENNEVSTPHGKTLQHIATVLGVMPSEIESY